MSKKVPREVIESELRQIIGEESVARDLTAKERLHLIQKLIVGRRLSKGGSLGVKGTDGKVLRELCAGQEFDVLDIEIKEDNIKGRFEVVFAMKTNGKRLPRGLHLSVANDGTLLSILELDVTKNPPAGESLVGMEFLATHFDLDNQPQCPEMWKTKGDADRSAAIRCVDELLQLAVKSQDRDISLN